MKAVRSMPVLAKIDDVRRDARTRASMPRSRSMSTHPEARLKQLIRSLPFIAFPGLGSELVGFQRSYSRQQISGTTQSKFASPKAQELGEASALLPPLPLLAPPTYTLPLVLAVFCSVLSSFQVGLNSGILNVPEATIRRSLSLSTNAWSLCVSIFCIGGLFGSLLGGRLADRIGRKNLLTSSNVLFISGALLEALAQNTAMLLLGRLVIGLGCGCATVMVPLYLGEIAPATLRGSLGSMNQFSIVIGILVANVLGRPLGMGEGEGWRYLLGLVLLPSLLQLVLSSVLLESPLWLMIHSSDGKAAEDVLTLLRGADYDDLSFELELMQQTKEDSSRQRHASLAASLASVSVRRSLMIGLCLQLFQQFSGINAVFYYSTAFFSSARVSDPWLASVLASTINVLATALAIPLMDRTGRRTLLMLSAAGMMLSCCALTLSLTFASSAAASSSSHYASASSSSSSLLVSALPVLTILAYVFFFEIGLGPITWLIGAEVYPSSIRALGMSLASLTNWSSNFIISLSFPHLSSLLRCYCFVPFAAVLLLCLAFVYGLVPETRGKSLEQIQQELGGRGAAAAGGPGARRAGQQGRGREDGEGDVVVEEGSEGYESDGSGSWAELQGSQDDAYSIDYAAGEEDASSDGSQSPMALTPVSGGRGAAQWTPYNAAAAAAAAAAGREGREGALKGVRAVSR